MHRKLLDSIWIALAIAWLTTTMAHAARSPCPDPNFVGSFLNVRAEGLDLLVQLAWAEHCEQLPSNFTILLETRDGVFKTSSDMVAVPTYGQDSAPEGVSSGAAWGREKMEPEPAPSEGYWVRLAGALTDVRSENQWSYRLRLLDSASHTRGDIAEPFPFHVVAGDCSPGEPFEVLPGVSTDAVVVSLELDQAIAGCGSLNEVALDYPHLACEIDYLWDQLNALQVTQQPGVPRRCYWQAVVFGEKLGLAPVAVANNSTSVSHTGSLAGPSHCLSTSDLGSGSSTTALSKGACTPTDPYPFLGTFLKVSCYDPVGGCSAACAAEIDYDALFEVVIAAEATTNAQACAWERVALWIQTEYVFDRTESMDSSQPAREPIPLQVQDRVPAGSIFAVSSMGSGEALAAAGGTAYAEYGNDYVLGLSGTNAVCATSAEAELSIQSPDLLRARFGYQTYLDASYAEGLFPKGAKAQLGGIKTRRPGL